jgi:phosphoribosylanthranilate isomerase
MVRVKICGITCQEDALAAAYAGADALGFIFAKSPRQVEPQKAREIIAALPGLVHSVGVFVDESLDHVKQVREFCGLDYVQLHGEEDRFYTSSLTPKVIRTLGMGSGPAPSADDYPDAFLLLDTQVKGQRGGTGKTFDWSLAAPIAARRQVMLAGGLNPDNVARAIKTVKPFAVDVSSGVELSPGRKDHERIAEFVKNAKLA